MTLNEMIYEAITTDSRKRKCRHQAELEALGYKIIKDGSWKIRNTKTDRYIDLPYYDDYLRTSSGNIRFGHVWSRSKREYVNKPLTVVNFEGILNTDKKPYRDFYGDEWTNVNCMRMNLHDRDYHSKELANSMSEYQKQIDKITKEYQEKIASAKSHYKWSVEYHTDSLKRATDKINELLHRTA